MANDTLANQIHAWFAGALHDESCAEGCVGSIRNLIDSALASQEARHQKAIKDREQMRDAWEARAHEYLERLSTARQEMEEAKRERDDALDFLRRAAYPSKEIVSTCRLTAQNIDNYRRAGLMYVEPGGGLGWVVREATPAWWSGERAEQLEKRAEAAEQREREAGEREKVLREALKKIANIQGETIPAYNDEFIRASWVRDAALAAIRCAPSPVSAPPTEPFHEQGILHVCKHGRGCDEPPSPRCGPGCAPYDEAQAASPVEPGSDPQADKGETHTYDCQRSGLVGICICPPPGSDPQEPETR